MQEELFISFENYLNNEMSLDERNIFENQLQNDSKLREQFELFKETNQFLELKFSKESIDFKENLKKISSNHFSKKTNTKPKVISIQSKWFSIAALLVVFMGIWFLSNPGNPSYLEYNQHENANFVERSENNQNVVEAQNYFNAKQYKKANEAFAKIELNGKTDVQLFYAISLIETNQFDDANALLQDISKGESVYVNDAFWYLALASLKQKKYVECKKYVTKITDDSEKYNKAQILLNDLD